MEVTTRPSKQIFPLLIAVSFVVGWFVPAFYEWTGTDQSRPSPLIGQTASGLTIGAIVVCLLLPWLPIAGDAPQNSRTSAVRFNIRTVLVVTAVLAAIMAALMKFPAAVGGGLCAIAVCYLVRFWILHRGFRWQSAALLACMYLPFVWIVHADHLHVRLTTIWMALGLPALVPTMWISRLVGQHVEKSAWISMLLTGAQLVLGIWMIRLGPRRTIAYLLFILLMSTFGSFVLNALLRM